MACVDVRIQDVSAADEGAARETRANSALDHAEGAAITNDADLAPGEAAEDLVHSAAVGEMGSAQDVTIRRAVLLDAAIDHLSVIVHDRALARIGSFPACRGMDGRRARRISTVALSRLGLPLRALGGSLFMPLPQGFALRLDRGDTGKAGEGHQSESRIGPTIRSPHILSLQMPRARVAPPWKDVAHDCSARSTQRCELCRGTGAAGKL